MNTVPVTVVFVHNTVVSVVGLRLSRHDWRVREEVQKETTYLTVYSRCSSGILICLQELVTVAS